MVLAIHTLKPAYGAKHSKKKVGRGNASGHGTYSGHGGKGQTARSGSHAGAKLRAFKKQMQATPKLGGFKSMHIKPAEVYLSDLELKFNAGDTVNLVALLEKKLIKPKVRAAKILSTGTITKKLIIEGIKCTAPAAEAIKKAGGEIK